VSHELHDTYRCAWCHVLQCFVVCCSVLLCVAVFCCVLQCFVVCCSVSQTPRHIQVRESGRGFNPHIDNLRTWQPNPSQYRWQPSDVPLGTHSSCCVLQCFVVCCRDSRTLACYRVSLPMCLDSRGGVCCSVWLCVAVFC